MLVNGSKMEFLDTTDTMQKKKTQDFAQITLEITQKVCTSVGQNYSKIKSVQKNSSKRSDSCCVEK